VNLDSGEEPKSNKTWATSACGTDEEVPRFNWPGELNLYAGDGRGYKARWIRCSFCPECHLGGDGNGNGDGPGDMEMKVPV